MVFNVYILSLASLARSLDLNNGTIFYVYYCCSIRYGVAVTGSNKGIGFGICRQLASNDVVTVLTAIDEKESLEAVEKLKECGLSEHVVRVSSA